MSALRPRIAKAHIEITTVDGITYAIDLADHERIWLSASIDWNRPSEELSLEETGFSPWRQFRPGPDTIITVQVTGRGEMTRTTNPVTE